MKYVAIMKKLYFTGNIDVLSYSETVRSQKYVEEINKLDNTVGTFKYVIAETYEDLAKLISKQLETSLVNMGLKPSSFNFSFVYEEIKDNSFWSPYGISSGWLAINSTEQ